MSKNRLLKLQNIAYKTVHKYNSIQENEQPKNENKVWFCELQDNTQCQLNTPT